MLVFCAGPGLSMSIQGRTGRTRGTGASAGSRGIGVSLTAPARPCQAAPGMAQPLPEHALGTLVASMATMMGEAGGEHAICICHMMVLKICLKSMCNGMYMMGV